VSSLDQPAVPGERRTRLSRLGVDDATVAGVAGYCGNSRPSTSCHSPLTTFPAVAGEEPDRQLSEADREAARAEIEATLAANRSAEAEVLRWTAEDTRSTKLVAAGIYEGDRRLCCCAPATSGQATAMRPRPTTICLGQVARFPVAEMTPGNDREERHRSTEKESRAPRQWCDCLTK
jgi:hypothetical protein